LGGQSKDASAAKSAKRKVQKKTPEKRVKKMFYGTTHWKKTRDWILSLIKFL